MSDSEDEDEESRFQVADSNFGKSDYRFAQLDEEFEPLITSIFNHTAGRKVGIKSKLNFREVIFLESQLKMDIF